MFELALEMKFTIYEEYPVKERESLEKIGLLDFPFDLILACKGLKEFYKLEEEIKKSNSKVQRIGYWPTLKRGEGYWFSIFSERRGLLRILDELKERSKDSKDDRLLVKWDAELPLKKPSLYVKSLFDIRKNRRDIIEFLKEHKEYNLDIIVSEFPEHMWDFPINMLMSNKVLNLFGVSFDPEEYKLEGIVKMTYTSFSDYKGFKKFLLQGFTESGLRNEILEAKNKYGDKFKDKFGVAIGTLAKGEFGNEPLMELSQFMRDLSIADAHGVKKIYIYRLNGLTKNHIQIMKNYSPI